MTSPNPKILCVDDEPANLKLLEVALVPRGYGVVMARNGREALKRIKEQKIDLVLLDVMMPDMDGMEVCRTIKEDENYRNIPVVMITSLTSKETCISAIEIGADEFLTKPIDVYELAARCKNLLKLKQYRDELVLKNEELEKLHKLKEWLSTMIVHDLKGPVTGILGNLELVMMQKDNLNEKVLKYISEAKIASYSLLNMITTLLDINKLEEGKMRLKKGRIRISKLFMEAERMLSAKAQSEEKKIIVDSSFDAEVVADIDLLKRVLQNLTLNALQYVEEGVGEVRLSAFEKNAGVVFAVSDNGIGIPAEYHNKILAVYG